MAWCCGRSQARQENNFTSSKMPATGMKKLTPREHQILALLSQGLLYKEIAGQLGISASTVRAHLHSVYGKLAVKSRTEAVLRFLGRR